MTNPGHMPLAISMGDPAGIGPEVILKAWAANRDANGAAFFAVGRPEVFVSTAKLLGLPVTVQTISLNDALVPGRLANICSDRSKLTVCAVGPELHSVPGRPDVAAAPAVIAALDASITLIREGLAGGLVTAPIAKSVLYAAGFPHPGHTEYLGARAETYWPGEPHVPVMMLASPELRVVPVTIHIPLAKVPAALTTDLIVETGRITAAALVRDFGIAAPRLALCGLNPHAGENGTIGTEDQAIVAPAVAALRDLGIAATGPHPADTLFHAAARSRYDVVLGMYHDQVNIPIKTLAFDTGVNTTLGLPFVRTSPDHGTAFDIAGKGVANPASLIAAIQLARDMAARREVFSATGARSTPSSASVT